MNILFDSLEWVKEPIGGELSVDDNVKLAWSDKGPFGSGTATEHNAIVQAVSGKLFRFYSRSSSKSKVQLELVRSSFKESGRSYRRKIAKRLHTSVTSSSSDSDELEVIRPAKVDIEQFEVAPSKTKVFDSL